MEMYPDKDEVDEGDQTICQLCRTECNSFTSLVSHICAKHGQTKSALYGHWVHNKYLHERRTLVLGIEEEESVGLCIDSSGVVDENKFTCLLCKSVLAKGGCAKHMENVHKKKTSRWLTVRDARCLKEKKGRDYEDVHLSLTRALSAKSYKADAEQSFVRGAGPSSEAGEGKDAAVGDRAGECDKSVTADKKDKAASQPEKVPKSSSTPHATDSNGYSGPEVLWEPPSEYCKGNWDVISTAHPTVRRDPQGNLRVEDDGTCWRSMWVRCDREGVPLVRPVELDEMSNPYGLPAVAVEVTPRAVLAHAAAVKPSPFKAVAYAQSVKPQLPSSTESQLTLTSPSLESNILQQHSGTESQLSQASHKIDHLTELVLSLKGDKSAWKKDLPAIRIKQIVADCNPPLAKGEQGTLRASLPKAIEQLMPFFGMDGFAMWLGTQQLKQSTCNKYVSNARRLLGFIEVKGDDGNFRDIASNAEATDVKLLLSFMVNDFYAELLAIPLLDFKYGWSVAILDAMINFAKWQVWVLEGVIVSGEEGPFEQCKTVLCRLLKLLNLGYSKKARLEQHRKTSVKFHEDIETIKKLPSVPELRAAVETGYAMLQDIATKYGASEPPLPKAAQGQANSIMVAAIWLDMFGGRKMEWELMTASQVNEMLRDGKDYLVCRDHKTSKSYGSLAKWLSPGVKMAVQTYMSLPRLPTVTTFLVPVMSTTDHVSIPSALKTFCVNVLPAGRPYPTVNIMRKFFHKYLMQATSDDRGLKEIMKLLDGHSVSTQDKYYSMREPEDDVKLAKFLVKKVLDKTAEWPSKAHVANLGDQLVDASMMFRESCDLDDGADLPDADLDADGTGDDLDAWEHGEYFGMRIPLPVLTCCDYKQEPIPIEGVDSHETLPIADISSSDAVPCDDRDERSAPADSPTSSMKRKHPDTPVSSCSGSGRTSYNGPDCKAWIIRQHAEEQQRLGLRQFDLAPTECFQTILEQGIAAKKVPPNGTPQGLRSLVRRHLDSMHMAKLTAEAKEKVKQKKHEKKHEKKKHHRV